MTRPDQGKYPISQLFGENPQIYSRFGMLGHNGIDLACPTGTTLVAPHSGKITEIGNDQDGYGIYLKIESDFEGSVLAHNKQILVEKGQYVDEGQAVCISDNTGFSTGPHSHWGYFRIPRDRTNGFLGYIDPTPYMTGHDIIKPMIPAYLQTLLQENSLDINNESAIREFFQKAINYDSLKLDKENGELVIRELNREIIRLQTALDASISVDLGQVNTQQLLIALIKKIFK